MVANLKVVELNKVRLDDIPGQLRMLADAIEAGDHGDVPCLYALMPREGDYPCVWGWGDVERVNEPIIQFELAKNWMVTNLVAR